MRRLTKTTRRVLTLLIAFCMMFAMVMPVMADDEKTNTMQATDDPRESIMLMALVYEDVDKGTYEIYKTGTCFLINDEYVLTNRHVVTLIEEEGELEELRKLVGIPDLQPTDSHIKLYLYVNRDMKVLATMHESVNSKDMDFAAVKLAEKIYDRKPIALGDSDKVEQKDEVSALGFPADSEPTKNYNTKDDVSVVVGAVSKVTVMDSIDVIEHTAPLNFGNSGGPLLDENNNVIGVNSYMEGKKNYSIQINYIRKGLDTFGIPYATGSDTATSSNDNEPEEAENSEEPTEPEVPDNTAILAELQSVLDEAKAVDASAYTEESVQALDDAIGKGETVLANTAATAPEIQSATDALNDAIAGLEEKSGPNLMLIGIIAAAVIIVVVIIIVVVMSGKKKKAAPSIPVSSVPQGQAPAGGYTPNPAPQALPVAAPQAMPEGAGETTLLDAGAGETTLLSNAGSAYLIRKKNGEKIAINTQNFKIGKERRRVNYCISDNTSVSRVHCEITKKGADYYVTDQGATNFTFVNGVQLSPQKETLLSDCSVLKLSDEEFEFHLS